MLSTSAAFLWAAFPAAILVGLAKGGLPIVGMLGVPILALVTSPIEAAGLLLPIYVVTDMFGLWAYRREYDRRNLAILIPASVFGVLIGWATATIVPEAWVTLLVGVIGIAYCVTNYLRRNVEIEKRPADVPRGLFWGTVTGFVSFVSHSGGPPFQVYVLPQKLPKMVFAGTSTILFAIVNAAKLVPYWALGQLSVGNIEKVLILVPAGVIATFAGVRLTRVVPEKPFFIAVEIALFAVSLKLVWDGLHGIVG
jgi:uncharacterized protein